MNRYKLFLLFVGAVILTLSFTSPAMAIKKCKDADGKWHYGDIAVIECENSKITTLNDRGFITHQDPAPKTEAQLLAEKQQAEVEQAEADRIKDEENERLRVLSIYETEADIDRQRDNQINNVQGNIDVHKAYLKSMRSRVQRYKEKQASMASKKAKENYQTSIDEAKIRIQNSKNELTKLQQQKILVVEKFAKEKKVYLALKNAK